MKVLIEGNLSVYMYMSIYIYVYNYIYIHVVVGQNVRPGGPQILVHFDINHPFLPIAMYTCIYIYM